MSENYKVYLGSDCGRNYEESVQHVLYEGEHIDGRGYYDIHDTEYKSLGLEGKLNRIATNLGNSLACMRGIGTMYEAKASSDLLLHADVRAFKQNAYVGGKLSILGDEDARVGNYFLSIMSDNTDLINFISARAVVGYDGYSRSDPYPFFKKNIMLALAGEWEKLKPRAEMFINEPNRKRFKNHIPDHEFFIALCDGDMEAMETALNKLLMPRIAKQRVKGWNVWFDFYLHIFVVMYGKIASIHGYDLNIDHPTAPKELIKYEPLENYEDPYDFMKTFDYNNQQGWIDMWKARMAKAKAEEAESKKLRNRILGFFRR